MGVALGSSNDAAPSPRRAAENAGLNPEPRQAIVMSEAQGGSRSVLASAIRYAVVDADAWTLRTYGVVGTLAAVFVALLALLAFPQWVLATDGGPLDRVGRAFLVLVALGVLAAVFAPLLFVDRRRRVGRSQHQLAFGLVGYVSLLGLYLALVVSAPPDARSDPPAVVAPVVEGLYALPPAAGAVIALVGLGAPFALEYGLRTVE